MKSTPKASQFLNTTNSTQNSLVQSAGVGVMGQTGYARLVELTCEVHARDFLGEEVHQSTSLEGFPSTNFRFQLLKSSFDTLFSKLRSRLNFQVKARINRWLALVVLELQHRRKEWVFLTSPGKLSDNFLITRGTKIS